MKKYLTLILLVIILSGCDDKPNINNPQKRNENWCWFIDKETGKGEWVPIRNETTINDGDYALFFCNGEIRQKGKLKNGKDCDTIFYFGIQGELISRVFQDDKGDLQEIMTNGKYKRYYSTCEVSIEGEFKNNKQIGTRTEYFKNGNIRFQSTFINDSTRTFLEFGQNGRILDSTTKINEKLESIRKHWYPNGQLEALLQYKEGRKNCVCTWYYKNGQVYTECKFINDTENGILISFYEKGNLKSKGLTKNGKEEGIVLHFFEDGQLDSKTDYSNGKSNGEIWLYHSNGQLKMHATSKNGVTTYYKWYNENGKLIKEYDGNEIIDNEKNKS